MATSIISLENLGFNINDKFENFSNLVHDIIEYNIPLLPIKPNKTVRYPDYILKSNKDKQNYFYRLKSGDILVRSEYNKACKRTKNLIKNFLNIKLSKISNNYSLVRNHIKNSLKPHINIPPLFHNNIFIVMTWKSQN